MPHLDFKFTNDLIIDKGDIVMLSHSQAIGQAIRDRLATFKGEWFLDLQFGPDYRKDTLLKNARIDVVNAILKDEILKTASGTFTEFEIKEEAERSFSLTYSLLVDETSDVISDTITI